MDGGEAGKYPPKEEARLERKVVFLHIVGIGRANGTKASSTP